MNDKQVDDILDALNEIDSTLMRISNSLSSLVSIQESRYGS